MELIAIGVLDGRTVCTCSLYHTARGRCWSNVASKPARGACIDM